MATSKPAHDRTERRRGDDRSTRPPSHRGRLLARSVALANVIAYREGLLGMSRMCRFGPQRRCGRNGFARPRRRDRAGCSGAAGLAVGRRLIRTEIAGHITLEGILRLISHGGHLGVIVGDRTASRLSGANILPPRDAFGGFHRIHTIRKAREAETRWETMPPGRQRASWPSAPMSGPAARPSPMTATAHAPSATEPALLGFTGRLCVVESSASGASEGRSENIARTIRR